MVMPLPCNKYATYITPLQTQIRQLEESAKSKTHPNLIYLNSYFHETKCDILKSKNIAKNRQLTK